MKKTGKYSGTYLVEVKSESEKAEREELMLDALDNAYAILLDILKAKEVKLEMPGTKEHASPVPN